MKTDDLINAIVQDGVARPHSIAERMAGALGIGGFIALVLFAQNLGVRPDIGSALQTWRFDSKLGFALACFATALYATAHLARPGANQRKVFLVLALPILLLAFTSGWELLTSPADSWVARAIGSNSRLCLASITVLSIAPLAALLLVLRTGAPRSPTMAGAVAGLLAGGLAATLYAIHCVDDSPLFVVLWYLPAVALVVLIGAAAGSRILRW
jgi:hypothetical protein